MIYTSYFDNLPKISDYYYNKNKNVVFVSIAKYPKYGYVQFNQYNKLAPTDKILWDYKNNGGKKKYIKMYNEEIIGKLNIQDVLTDIQRFIPSNVLIQLKIHRTTFWESDIVDVILVCYESYEEDTDKEFPFCHRFIVSDWFNKNGIPCSELKLLVKYPYTATQIYNTCIFKNK